MRRAVVVAVIVLLGVGGGVGTWLWASLVRPATRDDVEVVIAPGTSAQSVLRTLESVGVLPSVVAGRVYLAGWARGRSLHYGRFLIPAGSRPFHALERILDGRVETLEVTIVEGSTAEEIGALMSDRGFGDLETWRRLVADPAPIADLAPEAPSLEGFLFPDTYRFAIGTPPPVVVEHLLSRFRTVWREVRDEGPAPWGSTLEVVTLASLVEAETSLAGERPRVAGVFINRLRRGMLLQCDPTVVYALKRQGAWSGRLLRLHWQLDDPYNTYRYPGLPPGPICSPGRAAVAAAAAPEQHDLLYFVARPGGGHSFSKTLREHNQAVARLLRSRR